VKTVVLKSAKSKNSLDRKQLSKLVERFWQLRDPMKSHKFLDQLKVLHPVSGVPMTKVFPQIANDWIYELNLDYSPDDFNRGSNFMVWWRCPEGPDHVYAQAIGNHFRACRDESEMNGCPFCAGLMPSVTNSLASLYPHLVQEWDEKRNGRSADLVVANSNKPGWWRCSKNKSHRWQSDIINRTASGAGCPNCLYTYTDLDDYPIAKKQFRAKDNPGVDPHRVKLQEQVLWRCPVAADHVWESSFSRTNGVRCPFCRGVKASSTNNLTMRKDLLAEFHPTKNRRLKPEEINLNSHRKIWWKCSAAEDHEWKTMVTQRGTKNRGCPFCLNRELTYSNSLAGAYPKLAKDLHPTENGKLTADKILAATTRVVWWKGACGHEWQQRVRARTLEGHGCTQCWVQLRSERFKEINEERWGKEKKRTSRKK
jgi:hypothetical protein